MKFDWQTLPAIRIVFWGRASFLFLLCISAWLLWLTGVERMVSGDAAEGCYLDGDRTRAVTTAIPVVYDSAAAADSMALAGHAISLGSDQFAPGDPIGYALADGDHEGELSGPSKGLPAGGCGLRFGDMEFPPSDYVSGGRLWLVDCCDDEGTVYQATEPDWDEDTTWPESFPPRAWDWQVAFHGLPVQRLRSGAMGDVVTSLGMLTFLLMFLTSALLVWREWSMWAAERSRQA